LLGDPRDRTMLGSSVLKFQMQEFIKMACHCCTLTECLDKVRTFLLTECYAGVMYSVRRLYWEQCSLWFLSHFFHSFQLWTVLHTGCLYLTVHVLSYALDIFGCLYVSVFHDTRLHVLWGSCFLLLRCSLRHYAFHVLLLFSLPLSWSGILFF
jgi:hypothetical protein